MHDVYCFRSLSTSRTALAPLVLLASVLAASVLASPASAEQLFEVHLQAGAESQGIFDNSVADDTGSNSVNLSHSVDLLGADGLAKGAAGSGSVAVFSRSRYSVLDPSNDTSAFADATAIFTIDDLVFAGSGQLNNVILQLDLSGSMHVFGTTDVALSTLSISAKLNNQTINDAFRTVQLPPFFFADGALVPWSQGATSFNGTITVGPFSNLPTNLPLTLEIGMTMSTYAEIFPTSQVGNAAIAEGDLGSTLSFTSSGDVFSADGDLTSVNSVQGSIENGLWTGTPVSTAHPETSEVPALSTPMALLLALAIGAGALWFRLRPNAG